ncbi:ABC transporter substrate-binding protein [Paenibacillus roseipurpureus]|uniref:Extracellular solute-binding protein n=1 Tax=Paenibacillus roseopurpureus TaxID=2918901 RepID=A0AA96RIN3_9BACL|nr:extracellular solute-binding protein [Paenibacillus sp. MBLB1832]WNR42995.1 extracellular solute-binding protein [Paenibacillus sp. MBLB1832]
MKKMLTTAVTAIVGLSLLAGCGGQSQQPAATGGASTTATPQQKITLKVYHYALDKRGEMLNADIKKFESEHPNVTVESTVLVPGGSSLDNLKKLDVLTASGNDVDVVMMPNSDEVLARAAGGVLAPLDEFYTKNNVKPEEDYFVNPKYKGKTYAAMDTLSSWYVLLNQNAFEEAGVPLPKEDWTWDDFRDIAKKLTKGEGADKRYGAYFHSWGEYANPVAYTDFKNPYLKEDGTLQFTDPSYKYFFNLRRAMEKEDKSARPYADVVGAKLNYTSEFANGKAAMLLTGSWTISSMADTVKNPHTFKVAFAPIPRSSKTAEFGLSYLNGDYWAAANSSKHKTEAFELIRYLTTKGNINRGLPGYKKADGKAAILNVIGDKANLFNVDSLVQAVYDKRLKTAGASEVNISYGSQLKKVVEDGFSKFILDGGSFEDTQKMMLDEGKKIMDQNKK